MLIVGEIPGAVEPAARKIKFDEVLWLDSEPGVALPKEKELGVGAARSRNVKDGAAVV
jgi:hypothetical protein